MKSSGALAPNGQLSSDLCANQPVSRERPRNRKRDHPRPRLTETTRRWRACRDFCAAVHFNGSKITSTSSTIATLLLLSISRIDDATWACALRLRSSASRSVRSAAPAIFRSSSDDCASGFASSPKAAARALSLALDLALLNSEENVDCFLLARFLSFDVL